MNNLQLKKVCSDIIDGTIDRIQYLCDNGQIEDAESLYSEIRDWVIQKENLEIIALDYITGYFNKY